MPKVPTMNIAVHYVILIYILNGLLAYLITTPYINILRRINLQRDGVAKQLAATLTGAVVIPVYIFPFFGAFYLNTELATLIRDSFIVLVLFLLICILVLYPALKKIYIGKIKYGI
jgi:hypothetical protein